MTRKELKERLERETENAIQDIISQMKKGKSYTLNEMCKLSDFFSKYELGSILGYDTRGLWKDLKTITKVYANIEDPTDIIETKKEYVTYTKR